MQISINIFKMEKQDLRPSNKRSEKTMKEFLTLKEAAIYLSLSKSALYKKTSNKEILYYVPGGKVIYFLKENLDQWILNSKVTPITEFENSTENYLSRTSKNN